ncbi:S1C family serine protease [Alphaproteobacteria bacterium LSUCC0719]|jgi:S1-C subfamily serine protease
MSGFRLDLTQRWRGGAAWFCVLAGLFMLASAPRADHGPVTYSAAAPSVVVVEPTWPGFERPGFGAPPGTAPAGTGFYFGTGAPDHYILTAAHVVARAVRVETVDSDGGRHEAEIVAIDGARDLAVLRSSLAGQPIVLRREEPEVGLHACAIGNSFGLGLSFSCGVVSAVHRRDVGFNAIEDFVQTDAAVNPGASGGALVDPQGRLIGLIDGIFTKEADIDAGVNFAVSVPMILESLDEIRQSNPSIPQAR